MKQDWRPEELAQHWTLSPNEREPLGNKTGATRLSFAVLLKTFQFDGGFPDRREDVAGSIVTHLARQIGVPPEAYSKGEWSERTQRHQHAQIREHCGFRLFRAEDEPALVAWLSERVISPPEVRYTLLCALCWQRQHEITDNLVELLIHIAHRVGVRAEARVDSELMKLGCYFMPLAA
jgi:hypothetical protein